MPALVEPSEDHMGEGDRPHAVLHFLERHGFPGERRGDEERLAPGHVPVLIDPTNLGMARILERRQSPGQRARGEA